MYFGQIASLLCLPGRYKIACVCAYLRENERSRERQTNRETQKAIFGSHHLSRALFV